MMCLSRVSLVSLTLFALLGSSFLSAEAKEYSKWNPLRYIVDPEIAAQEEAAKAAIKPPKTVAKKETQRVSSTFTLPPHQGALIETQRGTIAIEFFPTDAPQTVENFVKLVEEGFYNVPSMVFHRVVPGFVVQTGDPSATGMGGSRDRVPLEVKNKLSHEAKGIVAMARGADPNSATSQFYITLAPQKSLDGKYTIFGRVVSGIDLLEQIQQGDRVYGVRMVDLTTITADKKEEAHGHSR